MSFQVPSERSRGQSKFGGRRCHWQRVQSSQRSAGEPASPHLRTGSRHVKETALTRLTAASRPRASASGQTTRQHLRLGVTPHFVQQAQGVLGYEVIRAEPAQLAHQIRSMIVLFAAENNFCGVVFFIRERLCLVPAPYTVYSIESEI